MRILTAIDVGYPVHGGAQLTHLTFLRHLAARGHDCVYLDASPVVRRQGTERLVCDSFRDLDELYAKIRRYAPDVLIGALTVTHEVAKMAHHLGIPCVAYLNSYEYVPPTRAELRAWQVRSDKPYPTPDERGFALATADRLLVNSRHLQRRLQTRAHRAARVIYPAFDRAAIVLSRRPADAPYVTGVCGYAHKGADIFLALARRFPATPFQQVGPVDHRLVAEFRALPNMTLLPFSPPRTFLAHSRIVLVPSQWPEPFGRIAVEAMANGIPTLVSRTGGLIEVAPDMRLSVGAFRDPDAWQRALAPLLDDPDAAARNAAVGRRHSARFLTDRSVTSLERVLRGLVRRPRRTARRRPVVVVCGRADTRTAYARINTRWTDGLRAGGRYDVLAQTGSSDFVAQPADCVVHHNYEEDFAALTPPALGRLVAVRTWDFGPFPPAWARQITETCDALWVYSHWVRRQAIAAGIPAGRVRVVPPGIDERLFRPQGPVYPLPTSKRCRFLFVGAPVLRKGIDILLKAYAQAFRRDDDVCLVIKGRRHDVFYGGIDWREQIAALGRDPRAPEVVYLDDELSDAQMAALYRACTVGVFPYRAEGFSLPILEAMACGLPSIVPRFGAALDFCTATTAFFVTPKRIHAPVIGRWAMNTLGFTAEVDEVDFCEVPVERLAEAMRHVAALPAAVVARTGARGARRARTQFRWSDAARRMDAALRAVLRRPIPVRVARQRRTQADHARIFAAAKDLFLSTARHAAPARRRCARGTWT